MNIWRLISYQQDDMRVEVLNYYIQNQMIAIGWGGLGELNENQYHNQQAIGAAILVEYPDLGNSHIGGPSLWQFWRKMQIGDLVIVKAHETRVVVEVTGDYYWNPNGIEPLNNGDYNHQRAVIHRPDINPDELINRLGTRPQAGQSPRWVLFKYPNQNQKGFSTLLSSTCKWLVKIVSFLFSTKNR